MDDLPEFRLFEGDLVHHHHPNHDHQDSSGHGIEPINSVDSEGNGIQQSIDVRDSYSGKLFVGGISWETSEVAFANYFSNYGEITDSVIMMDRHTGRPRGFGFVTFADPAVADKVLDEDHVIDGRTVEVKRTVPREDMMEVKGESKTKKIFVGGIPTSLTEDELREYFSSYGAVAENQIMLDRSTGRSRGFGFVTFVSEDAVERIFSEGKTHELGGKLVEIKKAEPKRSGADYNGGAAKFGFGNGASRHGSRNSSRGGHGGKMDRGDGGYGGYGGYGSFGEYGNYGGGFNGGAAGFYGAYGNPGGYGGYMYGFGFGGPMYGGAGYGAGAYGSPGDYSNAPAHGGGKGYGSGGGHGGSKGHRGGGSGSMTGRFHPY